MNHLYLIVLCLGFSVSTHASSSLINLSGGGVTRPQLLATHYLDRKETYYLGQEEIHEVHGDDHHNAMPKQPHLYDPELYRGR